MFIHLKRKKQYNKCYSKGSLLLELLIVVSLVVVIISVSANAMFLSMKSNKITGDKDTAISLAAEVLESTRSVIEEDWYNIYSLVKDTGHYYPSLSGNKWIISSGDETVNLNGISYQRYFTVSNVSRDNNTRDIQSSYSSADDDPSTQRVTVTVSWDNSNSISISEYFFRWRNKACGQGGWATGGSGNSVKNCTDTTYDTKDTSIDITGGTLKLQ